MTRHPIALALILSGLVLSLACGRKEAPPAPELPVKGVRLVPPRQGDSDGWVAATLAAGERAVLSTRMAASVRRVHVTEGQRVAAGALLVSLADDDLQGGLKAAEAALASASAHLRRIQALFDQDASTSAELEMAQTQKAQAGAAVSAARANLAYTQIRAPFAGVVQARRVNGGDFVGPGTPLVELEGQGAAELQGTVSEAEAAHLRIGQKIDFEADGRVGLAEITGLSTGGDPVSHRSALRARVLKDASSFRTGTFARIRIPGAVTAGGGDVFVPRSALVVRGELTGVFVLEDGHANLRWLSLGEPQGDRLPVRAGLTAKDAVIDQPADLRDGQPVTLANRP
ncbi:MAG TPA: efflux RND transporter periplasmic adaptor subunit [Holophaga sp.]|nr:efflux RND transporter periplasmic adaptor subunit [Holophaga sp.]HPS66201.1 efflux RND transporter periplasmic adaptor subunit [Holophaga sp.]